MISAICFLLLSIGSDAYKIWHSRSDQVAQIRPEAKTGWGDWAEQAEYCKPGSYAYAFELNVGHDGSSDDTGANGVVLFCRPTEKDDNKQIASEYKMWGQWMKKQECPGDSYLTGVSMRSQGKQGRRKDDSAVNNFKFTCQDGTKLESAGGEKGEWSQQVSCPANSAICGIKTRMENYKKYSDNTSLNDAIFFCCSV